MAFVAKNQTNPAVLDATGYTPYAMARLKRIATKSAEKSQTHKRDVAIRDYWIREKNFDMLENYVEQHKFDLFRSRWECAADKKGLHSRVKWQMDKVYEKQKEELEKRRKKLQELLKKDDESFSEDIKNREINPEQNVINMLERYTSLQVEKEKERQQTVKTKREQQFRENTAELRELISKKIHDDIYAERKKLSETKNRTLNKENEVDALYEEMWLKDVEAKNEKYLEEERLKKKINMENARDLKEQIKENEMRKVAIAGSIEEEAELLDQQRKVLAFEIEREKAQKKEKQAAFKKGLDKCIISKLKQRSKDVQNEIMMDLNFLTQIIDIENERQVESERKRNLLKEQQQYLNYLAERAKKEKEFEKKIDAAVEEECEKMWERREKEWEADRKRRNECTKKAFRECYEQIQEKLEKNRQVQKMRMLYAEEIRKEVTEDLKEKQEKQKSEKLKQQKYNEELLAQIKDKELELQKKRAEERKCYEESQKLQEAYEKQINRFLANPQLNKLHPSRLLKVQSSVSYM